MKVMIIGAAGMVGRKLTEQIANQPECLGRAISSLLLVDVVKPDVPAGLGAIATTVTADLSDVGVAKRLFDARPDLIFHLAAVVSGESETNFEKGYRINLDGARGLFDAIRSEGLREPYRPRVVFASSIAVFGAPFPDVIDDSFFATPLTSYGTQKAITELLLADYSRRGIFDGIGLRLPTICVRPGKPNLAASSFFSNIIREPLVGKEATLPVNDDIRHWFASPRSAVGFFIHAAALDTGKIGPRRNLTMPGVSATVGDQLAALERAAGPKALDLIRREPDQLVEQIVSGWPRNFETERAKRLGFRADKDFDDILRAHVEDELNGQL